MDKKCLAVLLVVIFVLQDPYVDRAYRLSQDSSLFSGENRVIKEFGSAGGFEVCYFLNGGAFDEGGTANASRKDLQAALAIPVKEGYNFAGWYLDSGFWHKATGEDVRGNGDCMLYAKWTKSIDGEHNVQMYPYRNTASKRPGQKKLKDCAYRFLKNVKIPGMPSTRETDAVEKRITETSQCLQGICMTEDYLLVSAYSGNYGGGLGCIHVFDRVTGEYCATVGVKKNSHMGGLAFDGENVWVCHSGSGTLGRIPYSVIRQTASKKPRQVVDCFRWFEEVSVSNIPSCIAYHDGKLWVATHTRLFYSRVYSYRITPDGLKQAGNWRIPEKVQGIAFDEDGKIYISASYGRRKSSYLKVYKSLTHLDNNPGKPMMKVEMPPCSEELELVDGEIYILFESAGEKYLEGTDGKGTSASPVDEILVLPKESVLS